MVNKKGLATIAVVGIITIIALLAIGLVVAIKNQQPDIKSKFTTLKQGCDPTITPIAVEGLLRVADRATLGVEPEISDFGVISARPAIGEMLGIASQDFAWKVELIDPETNSVLDSEKGDEIQEGGSSLNDIPFVLYFKQPDNDCNGVIDDFKLTARAKINYDLLLESPKTITKDVTINYVGGKLT